MAILQSCCCWKSVRKGSYASALYTAAYFGVTVVIMSLFVHEERHYYWQEDGAGPFGGKEHGGRDGPGGDGGSPHNKSSRRPMTSSFLEPEGISETSMTFNVLVLVCACCGIIASAILICGLYIDNRLLLIPWILVVVCTSVVDLSHIVYLIALELMKFNPLTAILFTVDFFLLTINVYSLLCVVSQYQEYKAGRGTAQYDDFTGRLPMIRYEAPPAASSCLGGSKRPLPASGRLPPQPTDPAAASVPMAGSGEDGKGEIGEETAGGEEEEAVRGEGWRKKRCPKRVQFPEDGGEKGEEEMQRREEEGEGRGGGAFFIEGGHWPPGDAAGQSAMLLLSSSSVAAAAAVVVGTDTAPLLSPKPASSPSPPQKGQSFFGPVQGIAS